MPDFNNIRWSEPFGDSDELYEYPDADGREVLSTGNRVRLQNWGLLDIMRYEPKNEWLFLF